MHNGLHSFPQRQVFRGPAGGYQPEYVRFGPIADDVGTVLTGSGLHRASTLTGQPSTYSGLTWALRVRNPNFHDLTVNSNGRQRWLSASQSLGFILNLNIGSGGSAVQSIVANGRDDTGTVEWSYGPVTSFMEEAREYIVICTVDGVAGTQRAKWFGYEWKEQAPAAGGADGVVPVTPPTPGMELGADEWSLFGGNYKASVDVAWFWLQVSSDASAACDLDDETLLAELHGDPMDFTVLSSPLVHFQGTAAEWNSGVNRGSGGNFFVNYPVTGSP